MENTVHKQECENEFAKIQEDQQNRKCIMCGSVAREWASVNNGVFMCLSCAAECKDLRQSLCIIKSVNLDNWTERQINLMKRGGNTRFSAFMQKFNLSSLNFEDRLCTRASVYYRELLAAQVDGIDPPIEPTYDEGRIIIVNNKKEDKQARGEADFVDTAKESLSAAYEKTKNFTKQTFNTIGQKITSEQFKKDLADFGVKAKDVAVAGYEKTKTGLSYLWGSISNKISQFGNKQ